MNKNELEKRFEKLYKEDIEPNYVKELEIERQVQQKRSKKYSPFFYISFIIFVFSCILSKFFEGSIIALVIGLTAFALIFIVGIPLFSGIDKFQNKIKSMFLIKLLKDFGDFYYLQNEIIKLNEIKLSGLFPCATSKSDDDNITGTYLDMPIYITETELTHEKSNGKSSHTVTDFKGLIVRTIIKKNYNGKTTVTQSGGLFEDFFFKNKGYEKVELEDIEFNKKFDIYSNNQVEARYMLTTTFMEKLKDINNILKTNSIHCTFEDKYITFYFETTNNFFEVGDIDNSLKENFKTVYFELAEIFDLIHHFNLDKQLGL